MARPVINERAFFEPRLRAVNEHLRERLSDPKRLTEAAARIANVTPGHFCRLFRSFVGVSFTDWQHAVRAEEAKRLIVERSLPLQRAAEFVGFAHYETFCRVFTRIENVSPKRLRPFVREHPDYATVVCAHTAGFVIRIASVERSSAAGLELLADLAELLLSFRDKSRQEDAKSRQKSGKGRQFNERPMS